MPSFSRIVGGICLLMALYAFQVLSGELPRGLGLMLLGLALIVAEAFKYRASVLSGIGGHRCSGDGVHHPVRQRCARPSKSPASSLPAVAFAAGAVLLATVAYFAHSRRQPVVTGVEQLLQATAVALTDFSQRGTVRVLRRNVDCGYP